MRYLSYLVAASGTKYGVLAQCFAETEAEARDAVSALFSDEFGEDCSAEVIDENARIGLWIPGDPDYIRAVISKGKAEAIFASHAGY